MRRLEVSGAVRPIYGSLGVKRLIHYPSNLLDGNNMLFHLYMVGDIFFGPIARVTEYTVR